MKYLGRAYNEPRSLDAGPSRQWAQCQRSCEDLCRFTLRTVFASLVEGSDCETLFALLDAALYVDALSTDSGTTLRRNE